MKSHTYMQKGTHTRTHTHALIHALIQLHAHTVIYPQQLCCYFKRTECLFLLLLLSLMLLLLLPLLVWPLGLRRNINISCVFK